MANDDVGEGDVIPYSCSNVSSAKVPEFAQWDGGSPKFIAVLQESFGFSRLTISLLSVFGSFRSPGSFWFPRSSGCSKASGLLVLMNLRCVLVLLSLLDLLNLDRQSFPSLLSVLSFPGFLSHWNFQDLLGLLGFLDYLSLVGLLTFWIFKIL